MVEGDELGRKAAIKGDRTSVRADNIINAAEAAANQATAIIGYGIGLRHAVRMLTAKRIVTAPIKEKAFEGSQLFCGEAGREEAAVFREQDNGQRLLADF